MNYLEAMGLVSLVRFETAWENANPYEDRCDEERCVQGRKCRECNPEVEDDE